jgi:4-hydroxyphenylacetate 3-monooxygenase
MGARTGNEYLERIRAHSPEVWVGGDCIKDVTEHPATRGGAREISRLYDLQHDPRYADQALITSPSSGDRVGAQFLLPRTAADLVQRRQLHQLWAESTYGLMGRSTDFMGAMLTAWQINAEFFGDGADRVRNYFTEVREKDLFLTHALADPPVDRSKSPSQQPHKFTYLGVEEETSEGLIVSGAKMLATASAYADEILVWPFSLRRYDKADNAYAISFAIPADTPGLRFISRQAFAQGNSFDNPLATRFDEMDAVVVFERVLVPWERVFINQDYDRVNRIWEINSNAFTGIQTSVRLMAKLQFAAGLAKRATEMVKTDQFPGVKDMIGEITTYIELTRAGIIAAEAGATVHRDGYLIPDVAPLFAIRNSGNRWYPRVRELLQQILAGALLYQPADVSAFDSPIREDLERFYRGADVSAEDRIKLYKLASDLVVSGFGGRHELYERFYAGDPMFLRINTQFAQYKWADPLRLVDDALGNMSVERALAERAASV